MDGEGPEMRRGRWSLLETREASSFNARRMNGARGSEVYLSIRNYQGLATRGFFEAKLSSVSCRCPLSSDRVSHLS